jgi:starch synthase
VLQQRRSILSGIINGVDYTVWNPATDPKIAQTYNVDSLATGKAACKASLQASLGLSVDPQTPLVGLVGRLVEQKGIDLVTRVMQDWVHRSNIQWAILGTGEPKYEQQLVTLAERFPSLVSVKLDFSDALAHQIEAGADIFLMPSRFEPCGLNQLYSLKYGTVPVVRSTGGLADSVTDTNEQTLAAGTATGFAFHDYSTLGLSEALRRAIDTYESRPEVWRKLQENGMQQDWSWDSSAKRYVDLYERLLARTRQTVNS